MPKILGNLENSFKIFEITIFEVTSHPSLDLTSPLDGSRKFTHWYRVYYLAVICYTKISIGKVFNQAENRMIDHDFNGIPDAMMPVKMN